MHVLTIILTFQALTVNLVHGLVLGADGVPVVRNTTDLGGLPGLFERSIKDGVRFLRSNGAGNKANLRTVVARPLGQRPSRIASDFKEFEIDIVDRERRLGYITRNDGPNIYRWSQPQIVRDNETYFLPWKLDDYTLSLDEAIYLVEGAGYKGPWDNIVVFFPVKDPLESKAGREAYIGFHTEDSPRSFPAIGMETRKIIMYSGDLPEDEMQTLLSPQSIVEVQ